MTSKEVLSELASRANPAAVEGMARFGIRGKTVYGWSVAALRKLAQRIGKNHKLAGQLWASEVLDARLLATLIDEPEKVGEAQAERWAKTFDSWAVCDGACLNLFRYTPFAYRKCVEWSARQEEFVKRAGFALMATLAVSDRAARDEAFLAFLPLIQREAADERNYVKKAMNWALRQIGKRNRRLNRAAVRTARTIRRLDSRSARWIAADALRELTHPQVQQRLRAAGVRSSRLAAEASRAI